MYFLHQKDEIYMKSDGNHICDSTIFTFNLFSEKVLIYIFIGILKSQLFDKLWLKCSRENLRFYFISVMSFCLSHKITRLLCYLCFVRAMNMMWKRKKNENQLTLSIMSTAWHVCIVVAMNTNEYYLKINVFNDHDHDRASCCSISTIYLLALALK